MSTKQSRAKVLAIGAAGPFASLVIPELAKRGAEIRGFIRKEDQRAKVIANGASEIAIGDLRETASVEAALQGMEVLFYIAPAFVADEASIGKQVVEAAFKAGVRRIVFSSVIHPTLSSLDNHRDKGPVENAIFESGLEYVILQPAMFFQNIARGWPDVLKLRTYSEPWSAETKFTRVDYRDVAEVAAIAMLEDRLLYGTFELCAEGNVNRHAIAALMSRVLGHEIKVGTVDPQKAAAQSHSNAGQSPLQKMIAWYNDHALLGNATTLRAILGREPRTFEDYIEELRNGSAKA
jgi:uncharacterized protein YbjT (DUF2867 family)